MLAGRWLIEISAPDGYNADSSKDNQLLWVQHHADRRGLDERVALFYNGQEATAPPPLSPEFCPHTPIVAMHFLANSLLALPEAMMRDEKEGAEERAERALQDEKERTQHEKEGAEQAIRRRTMMTIVFAAAAVSLTAALARKGRNP